MTIQREEIQLNVGHMFGELKEVLDGTDNRNVSKHRYVRERAYYLRNYDNGCDNFDGDKFIFQVT